MNTTTDYSAKQDSNHKQDAYIATQVRQKGLRLIQQGTGTLPTYMCRWQCLNLARQE